MMTIVIINYHVQNTLILCIFVLLSLFENNTIKLYKEEHKSTMYVIRLLL